MAVKIVERSPLDLVSVRRTSESVVPSDGLYQRPLVVTVVAAAVEVGGATSRESPWCPWHQLCIPPSRPLLFLAGFAPPSHFPLSLTLIDRVSGFVRIQLKVTGLGIFYYYGILELSSVFCDVYLRANKKTLKLILSDLLKSSDIWGNILTL